MSDLKEILRNCINEEEVWELMKNVKVAPDCDAKIGDKTIRLPDSHEIEVATNIPNNDYGLAARILSYLQFNGYLGHSNYSGGPHAHLGKFLTLWNDLNDIKPIESFREIDEALLEKWIRTQLDKGNGPIAIMRKFNRLVDWKRASKMLPDFLMLDHLDIYACPSYADLKAKHDEASGNWREREPSEKSKYPLHLLLPILQEAITYLTKYTADIELLMNYRIELQENNKNVNNVIHRFMKSQKHEFKEPDLSILQVHCKNTKGGQWKSFEYGLGPKTIINEAVGRWQAANLILLGFFTASRSNEISRQVRNIATPRTKYHELDRGYKFTRIAWKPARNGKLITTPLPPLGLKSYRNLCRHSMQFDGKKTGKLIFKGWTLRSKEHADRMNIVLKQFSWWVHGEDTQALSPHQLRHAMASLMTYLNDPNGIMLAAKLLGHDSTAMTMSYEAQLKNIILNQLQFIGETNEEVGQAYREYKEEESMSVLDNVLLPALKDGKVFAGNARGFVDLSGDIVNDVESWYQFHSAAIKAGEEIVLQGSVCVCVHSTKNPNQMACQRGINITSFAGVPPQISNCQGSSCPSSLFTEQACEKLMNQSLSVKDLAPEDLKELAKDWFYVIGDELDMPDQRIIDEYVEAKNRQKPQDIDDSIGEVV